jgi:hypothetical protein
VILGCVSKKHAGPKRAKELYASPLWAKRRSYAEKSGRPWVIFSAKHGILDPDDLIEWYDVALKRLPSKDRRAKGELAARQLAAKFGSLKGLSFEIHAGDAYVSALRDPLRRAGATLVYPLAGLSFGYQLQWYGAEGTNLGSSPAGQRRRPRARELPRFALQFDRALVRTLAGRYQYGGDERVAAVGASAGERGYFTRAELRELCFWKTPRSAPLVAANSTAEVRQATRLALSQKAEDARIRPLLALSGVSWPTASVVLHFAHRDPYPILDVRALEALGCLRPTYSMSLWLQYVEFIRELATSLDVDVRTLDRALWQWSKERSR